MSFASFTERIRERMKADGSYEQMARIKKFLFSPFGGGKVVAGGWRSVLPVLILCSATAGLCSSLAVKGEIINDALKTDIKTAELVYSRPASFAEAGATGDLHSFAETNPFHADPMPGTPGAEESAAAAEEEAKNALKDMTLRGTLPGIAAWIADKENTRFYLRGQKISGYTLEEIRYNRVTLADTDQQRHTLHLIFARGEEGKAPMAKTTASAKTAPKRRSNAAKAQTQKSDDFPGIEPASGDMEGVVPRELVDKLLMDPYDELSKLRMEPSKEGDGLQLKRIDKDSVFARVGVARGDVIQAVNGVEIKNMADAANAVNSLMSGTRFDIKVQRGGKPLDLKYQVK